MLKPGEIIDERYIVEARLGQGGLAEVFRVRHRELNSVHALKLLVWRRQSLIERILLEGRIQAQIRHPNVVAVTDVIRHDGRCGLLMEYIDGPTLEHYLRQRGALPTDDALSLIAPVIAAITAAHDAGVLHRDLKPANVLLARMSGGLLPKVADFGIAKVVVEDMARNATAIGSLMGSPGYLAPEQVIDSGAVDQRADIYALGVMLYEILSGARAFPEVIDATSAREAIDCTPLPLRERIPDCPEYLSDAVQTAMSRERDERFPDCRSLARALFAEHPRQLALVDRQQLSSNFSLDLIPSPQTQASTDPTLLPLTDSGLPSFNTQPDSTPSTPSTTESGLKALVVAPLVLAALLLVGLIGGGVVWYLNQQAAVVQAPSGGTPAEVVIAPDPSPEAERPPVEGVAALDGAEAGASTEPAEAEASAEPAEAEASAESAPPEVTAAPEVVAAPREDAEVVTDPDPEPTAAPEVTAPEDSEAVTAPEDSEVVTEPEGDASGAQAVPVAALDVVTDPEAEPAPEAAPEPESPAVELSGLWSGTADQRPLQLRITDTDGSIRAEYSFLLGSTQRTIIASGTFDPVTGVFQVTSSAEGLSFQGRLSGSTLSGTYKKGRKGKAFQWSASR